MDVLKLAVAVSLILCFADQANTMPRSYNSYKDGKPLDTMLTQPLKRGNVVSSNSNLLLSLTLKAMDRRFEALEKKTVDLTKQNNELERKNVILTAKVARMVSVGENKGFFTASLKKHLYTLGAGQTIKFDHVIYDPGQNYNKHSGIFTCPVDGVYMFHVSVMGHSGSSNYVGIQIVKSGVPLASVFEKGSHGGSADLVVIRCNVREQVWIRIKPVYSGVNLYGDDFTSFSGALLHPL